MPSLQAEAYSQSGPNVVQSYANGSVKAINITEGDYVEKDDVLIELDTQSLLLTRLHMTAQHSGFRLAVCFRLK